MTTCDDCGAPRETENGDTVPGFGSAITHDGQSRIYCADCRQRRGLYIFDSRSWAEITAEPVRVKKSA